MRYAEKTRRYANYEIYPCRSPSLHQTKTHPTSPGLGPPTCQMIQRYDPAGTPGLRRGSGSVNWQQVNQTFHLTRRLNVGPSVCNSAQLRFTTNNRELNNDGVYEEEDMYEEEGVPKRRQSRPRKGIAAEYEVKGSVPEGLDFRVQQGGKENLAFVFNYKAAHKFAVQNLQLALANDRLFMDVMQRVNGNRLSGSCCLYRRGPPVVGMG